MSVCVCVCVCVCTCVFGGGGGIVGWLLFVGLLVGLVLGRMEEIAVVPRRWSLKGEGTVANVAGCC